MLVVTANWGWMDGTLAPAAVGRATVRGWLAAVQRGIVRGGFRRDGRYRPVEAVDIVFAGDTFDWLVSEAWLGTTRPWHAGRRAREARTRVALMAARRAAALLVPIARWAREGVVVPRADRHGRPVERSWTRVPVRVAVLAGDRDSWLDEVAARAALRGCSVGTIWRGDAVIVWHGHEHDPVCRHDALGAERAPTLAESVVVDLVAAFGAMLRTRGPCVRAVGRLVAALAAAGPLDLPGILAAWLDAETARGTLTEASLRSTIEDWRRAVARWHRAADAVPPTGGPAGNVTDALAAWLDGGRVAWRPGAGCWPSPPAGIQDLAAPAARELTRVVAAVAATAGLATRSAVVLGHPRGGLRTGDPPVTDLVCLAARPERRWGPTAVVAAEPDRGACVAAPAEVVPVAVAARTAAGRLEWVPLGADVRDGLEGETAPGPVEWIVDAA
jgi:hypothetical protein